MAQRLTAAAKRRRVEALRRRVEALRRQVTQAERAYDDALEQDRQELARRAAAKAAHVAAMDARKRARIIARAERPRQKKSAWWERARVRMLYPLIG